ncbi:MAG: DUF3343 domain-containing protein [Agathobaculum sp.]|uniref:DUF3343 domain-containing protein n=1 Tax=Agathobaculum sp. TaxID=2048138 RepID=UPI0025C0BF3D|nr:DUF3343 domain-containing protein [Agathobaculum sp.]MCI7125616.1 DUF3343 domain-containing protein [Agathobaculum sp.]MDY3710974.1 DUF3343 domain-containing protein [Agathobaculum sp.]
MSHYALLICRSQTEAIGLRRHLTQMGIPGEVTRPPRHARTESCGWAVRVQAARADEAVHRLRLLGAPPCHVIPDEEAGR